MTSLTIKSSHLEHDGGTKEYFTHLILIKDAGKNLNYPAFAVTEWGGIGKKRQINIDKCTSWGMAEELLASKNRSKTKGGYKDSGTQNVTIDATNLNKVDYLLRDTSPHNHEEIFSVVFSELLDPLDSLFERGEEETSEAFATRKSEEYGGNWGGWS